MIKINLELPEGIVSTSDPQFISLKRLCTLNANPFIKDDD